MRTRPVIRPRALRLVRPNGRLAIEGRRAERDETVAGARGGKGCSMTRVACDSNLRSTRWRNRHSTYLLCSVALSAVLSVMVQFAIGLVAGYRPNTFAERNSALTSQYVDIHRLESWNVTAHVVEWKSFAFDMNHVARSQLIDGQGDREDHLFLGDFGRSAGLMVVHIAVGWPLRCGSWYAFHSPGSGGKPNIVGGFVLNEQSTWSADYLSIQGQLHRIECPGVPAQIWPLRWQSIPLATNVLIIGITICPFVYGLVHVIRRAWTRQVGPGALSVP